MLTAAKANAAIIVLSLENASNRTLFQARCWSSEAIAKAFFDNFKLEGQMTSRRGIW
jgi:hypothetical protein